MCDARETPLPGSGFKEAYEKAAREPTRPTLRPVPRQKSPQHIKALVKDPAWQARARGELNMALREFHDFDAALVAVFFAGVKAAAESVTASPAAPKEEKK